MSDEPIQYKRGWVEFYKLKFKVSPDVLIPRPETELLVDQVVEYFQTKFKGQKFKVLDIGTGSGNIAISIAKKVPGCHPFGRAQGKPGGGNLEVVATDVSVKALDIARINAKFHRVYGQISFIQSDLLEKVDGNFFDVIVTNLPYIPDYRLPYLDKSVTDFEPHVALKGGVDGFDLYRKLFQQLKEKGIGFSLLLGEIDYTQATVAQVEAEKFFPGKIANIKLDLARKQRFLVLS